MISDFQLVLIGAIAVVIVGMVVYNRWQEAVYKKRADQLFGAARSDALFNPSTLPKAGIERREPTFGAMDSGEQQAIDELTSPILAAWPNDDGAHVDVEPRNLVRGTASELVPTINTEVDTVAMMLADVPVAADIYAPMIEQSRGLSRSLLWEGLVGGLWQPIDPTLDTAYREIRVGLQLADRGGAVEPSVLAQFDEMMASFAASIGAVSQREDMTAAQRRAQMIDRFCAETDIEIAVNVVGKNGVTFAATKVRGLAEAQGLSALPSGEYVLKDDYGRVLFCLRNGYSAEAPTLRGEQPYFTQITFALDVPRTPEPGRIFERMFTLALQFADVLHGELVDDNKKLLTANGRKVIGETILGITGEMQNHGVAPGCSVALRLYA